MAGRSCASREWRVWGESFRFGASLTSQGSNDAMEVEALWAKMASTPDPPSSSREKASAGASFCLVQGFVEGPIPSVAVKEFRFRSQNSETILFTTYPYCGNLTYVRRQRSRGLLDLFC